MAGADEGRTVGAPQRPGGGQPAGPDDARAEKLAIDAVKVLSMDAVQAANSGHPGTPMALAPVGYVLWARHLRHNPADPTWPDRDRFVLSCGHASMLIYSLLHLSGYDLPLEELRNFRQWGSRTPGHPEVGHTPGVETTTGPLGQGVANSVGMALTERWLAARFNRPGHTVVDHRTWVLCSDGDLMEGISHEAAAFAGHQRLHKLTWIFDDNRITIEGRTDLATSTDHAARMAACGWHVLTVEDGADLAAIDAALRAATEETERPTFIVLRTRIAEGAPNKVDTAAAHGAPLGEDEVRATRRNLGWPSDEPFFVPDEARLPWQGVRPRGEALQADWAERFAAYREAHPEAAAELERMLRGDLPADWDADVPDLTAPEKDDATRSWSGVVLNALARRVPELIGGSADLGGSNKTDIKDAADLLADAPDGRVIHFGVREHAMGGIMNGMALHGGVRPFGGTFLIFSDYMRPAIRMAALMELPVVYVFTHDSIGLGEDGPTHQPIEQLMSLRLVPNLLDLRPADGAETAEAWRVALERRGGPSFLSLTRQKVPSLNRTELAPAEGLRRGAYVLQEAADGPPRVVLLASGSEVAIALAARNLLQDRGVSTRVVSMPSWALFAEQDPDYRASVLGGPSVVRVAVEAGRTAGWERWTGPRGAAVGVDRFGASAPWDELYRRFGLTAERVADVAMSTLGGVDAEEVSLARGVD
ncbi:MAG: transketolase [Gemmatimonadetes bacterium]|nr:MAG: transketolase [Gemmatimonadota bacterium]